MCINPVTAGSDFKNKPGFTNASPSSFPSLAIFKTLQTPLQRHDLCSGLHNSYLRLSTSALLCCKIRALEILPFFCLSRPDFDPARLPFDHLLHSPLNHKTHFLKARPRFGAFQTKALWRVGGRRVTQQSWTYFLHCKRAESAAVCRREIWRKQTWVCA